MHVTASLHALRHTAVSNWIAAGMNAKAVQERAGHSSITVTMDVYGHLFESLSADQIETMDATILERLASAKSFLTRFLPLCRGLMSRSM